jgi:hypothetical protein
MGRRMIAFEDLGCDSCRWPTGAPDEVIPFLFCGEPTVPGRSYCRVHLDRAYTKLEPERQRPAPDQVGVSHAIEAHCGCSKGGCIVAVCRVSRYIRSAQLWATAITASK